VNTIPGYTAFKKANEIIAERHNTVIDRFEVLDLKTMSKTEIFTNKQDAPKFTKNKKIKTPTSKQNKEDNNSLPQSNFQIKNEEVEQQQTQMIEAIFITPYTEVSVDCIDVVIDNQTLSVITSSDDKVKVRPARGAELSVKINGELYNLYSSGIYIPIKSLNAVMSIFFVMDEKPEA
jgi:hypothetical protein